MAIVSAYVIPHTPLSVTSSEGPHGLFMHSTEAAVKSIARDIRDKRPDTLIIITPHGTVYGDYFHMPLADEARGDLGEFGLEDHYVHFPYDKELIARIAKRAQDEHIPAGMLGPKFRKIDHGLVVPLWYIKQETLSFSVVRIGSSALSGNMHLRFGECIREEALRSEKRIVVIASGDMSHRLASGEMDAKEYFEGLLPAKVGDPFDSGAFFDTAISSEFKLLTIFAGIMKGSSEKGILLGYDEPNGVACATLSFEITE